jgi:3-oxoacyl-[acyl-carrier protein] reductase
MRLWPADHAKQNQLSESTMSNTKALENKRALVTGGSRGIGRGIALELAAGGAHVCVNYRTDEAAAREVVEAIASAGGQAWAAAGDIAELDEIDRLFAQVKEKWGELDILVNNAGLGEFVPFDQATPEHFDRLFVLNVRGLFFATQAALAIMADGGRVINISSIASRGLSGAGAAYGATKAAVNALTSALSKDLGERKITVNAVSPGVIDTDLARASFSDEDMERIARASLFGRAGTTDDVAGIVAFLASEQARWITGREIVADGGTL